MEQKCNRCGSDLVEIRFSEEQKLEIWGLVARDLRIYAVSKIKDEYGLSHGDAKRIVAHFNAEYGSCHRCNYKELKDEYVDCPKCKSFNYNLKMNHK